MGFLNRIAAYILRNELGEARLARIEQRRITEYWKRDAQKNLERYEDLVRETYRTTTHSGNML